MKENKEEKTLPQEEKEGTSLEVPMRRIVILTDGNNIKIDKAEVSGKLEFVAILQTLINYINQQK